MEFEKSGMSYIIEKDQYESDDVFYKRAWFIVNKLPKTDADFKKQTSLSRIWANLKFNDCLYSDNIMKQIN